jgi:cytochrome c oxidase assembly factor CtaG
MNDRQLIAYAMVAALIVAGVVIVLLLRRASRRERREAGRPIQLTRKKKSD